MARYPFPRLEAVLGEAVGGDLSARAIHGLVERRELEFDQLDFKRQYDSGDKGKADLASDVCALANPLGGIIVGGVAEHQGAAHAAMPQPWGDPDMRWLRSVLAKRTAPMPSFDLIPVNDDS